jgi:hypothetical protein
MALIEENNFYSRSSSFLVTSGTQTSNLLEHWREMRITSATTSISGTPRAVDHAGVLGDGTQRGDAPTPEAAFSRSI